MEFCMSNSNDLLTLTHGGEDNTKYYRAVVPPVYLTSLHSFDSVEDLARYDSSSDEVFYYGRSSNPTVAIAEKKIALLENGVRASIFSSGMAAATSAIFGTCGAGSHIICLRDCYQPIKRFLTQICIPKFNMSVTYVDGLDLNELEQAITPKTSLMILESPATFVFTVIDIEAIACIAKKHGITTYFDNSYCTPIFQKPLDLGIDIVMHTLSKYLGGHSDIIGGVLVSKNENLMQKINNEMRNWLGGIIGPMEGWLLIRSMRTLDVRVRQHQHSAMQIANYLENHPKIKRVYYTGLKSHPQADMIAKQQTGHTGLMSIELNVPPESAVKFVNSLKLFKIGVSWGGFESLAILPYYKITDEELEFLKMSDSRGLIRMHIGLEGTENLLSVINQPLDLI
jgi:cystathionine gamma-lyase